VDFDIFTIEEDAQSTIPRSLPRIVLSSQQRFPVRARPGTYQVRGFDRDRQVTWLPPPTGRLEADGPSVFDIGATGGFQLEPDEALVRGRSYLLLAPSSWSLAPPGALLVEVIHSSRLSDPRRDWQGHLLFLPQRVEEEIEDWCVDVFGRPLEDAPARLEVVFPPATETADGRLHVDQHQPIVLSLGLGWTNPVFEILNRKTGENPDWPLGGQVAFCRISPLPAGDHTILVKEETVGDVERLELGVDQPTIPTMAGVVLTTERTVGGPTRRADLLDEDAGERWAALLTGREELRSVQLPDGWRITLRWQGRDGTNHGPNSLDQAVALSTLIGCLQRRPRSARLDAGPFGAVAWCESAPQLAARKVTLSAALEARLRWVMLARRMARPDDPALGLAVPRATVNRLTAPCNSLVEDFLTVATWPVSLLPQARSVARDLVAQLEGTS
jgi:hypothetical protein